MIIYFMYLLKKHIISWRMLAAAVITVLIMDAFMASIRTYSKSMDVKMSQWGFALIWSNKYVVLCFMLIFIFIASAFPEDRLRERYIIARLGITKWVLGQSMVIIVLGWLYTIFLFITQNILLWNVMDFSKDWGKGWATLSNRSVTDYYNTYITVLKLVISNHSPDKANLLVLILMGLLLGMIGMLMFWLNFYSHVLGPMAASGLVFLSFATARNIKLIKFSPVNWIRLEDHYTITKTHLPTQGYMIGMILLMTILFLLLAKRRANVTQENNRRNIKWKSMN